MEEEERCQPLRLCVRMFNGRSARFHRRLDPGPMEAVNRDGLGTIHTEGAEHMTGAWEME